MAQSFLPPSDPDYPPTHQDRKLSRRWWIIGGLVVVLLLVGAAAAYAGARFAQDRESSAADPPPADPPSAEPSLPVFVPPTEVPLNPGRAFCRDVRSITKDLIGVDLDYVATVRDIADRLRQLDAPTPAHQAALDDLIDEFEAAARMVEDDPRAEAAAVERDSAAQFAFIDAGGCDPV